MDNNEDGDGWKIGLSFICIGIMMVMGMGVFSLLYHKGLKGTPAINLSVKTFLYSFKKVILYADNLILLLLMVNFILSPTRMEQY